MHGSGLESRSWHPSQAPGRRRLSADRDSVSILHIHSMPGERSLSGSLLCAQKCSFHTVSNAVEISRSSSGKDSASHSRRHSGSIPGSKRSPGGGNGNPLQYSCLENPMDRGAWRATVHGVVKSWTQLSDFTHKREKEIYISWKLCFLPYQVHSQFTRQKAILEIISIETQHFLGF